jgi:membrane-bound inhibitor of C-type lysozyme
MKYHLICDTNPSTSLTISYYNTEPSGAKITYENKNTIVFVTRSGIGSKYEGSNMLFWEKGGEAVVNLGGNHKDMHCSTKAQ